MVAKSQLLGEYSHRFQIKMILSLFKEYPLILSRLMIILNCKIYIHIKHFTELVICSLT